MKTYKGLDIVFHGGGDAGFRSYLLRVPEHKLTIMISGNFEAFNPLNISYGLLDLFLANEIKEPTKEKLPIYSKQELKKFEGDYHVFPGLYITILAEKETLYFKIYGTGEKIKLPVLGEDEFDFPTISHSKIKFYKSSLVWHFSDFYYPAKKVQLNPPKYASLILNDFKGTYTSTELETTYTFIIKNNKLIATHNFNKDVILEPIEKDIFITKTAYIGRVEFTRNKKGIINGCKISGQMSYNIPFPKTN